MISATPTTMTAPATIWSGVTLFVEHQRPEEHGDNRVDEGVGRDQGQRRVAQDPGVGGERHKATDEASGSGHRNERLRG